MRHFAVRSTLLLALGTGCAQAAPIISLSAPGDTTTAVAGVTSVDFNNGCGYASCTGDFQIVQGSLAGQYAQPVGTSSPFLAVPNPVSHGTGVFTLGNLANYFGLYWGSIDSYNSIAFRVGTTIIANFSGTDLVGAFADGNQLNYTSNRYINFDFGSEVFDSVLLTSNGYAFESDNHAFRLINTATSAATTEVVEPSAQLLLLGGLVALFGIRKRLATPR